MSFQIIEGKKQKVFLSRLYNYAFNKETGYFMRWGFTKDHDPKMSEYGPEILDLELSTICHNGCSFCYKSNTNEGTHMNLETYKKVLDSMPKTLTQVAFGIGDIDSNPDLWEICKYTRKKGIIPNITINGSRMKKGHFTKLKKYMGAVAVSNYDNDICFDTVKKLTDTEMKQVNIHQLLSEETYDKCIDLLFAKLRDDRLKDLNAIVFLSLKPKGERNKHNKLKDKGKYKTLIDFAFQNKISIGFDSCGANKFLEAVKGKENYDHLKQLTEPCESSLFSAYVDVNAKYYPCSFCEGEKNWKKGLKIINKDFLKDVWFNRKTNKFRKKMLKKTDKNNCRKCLMFDV